MRKPRLPFSLKSTEQILKGSNNILLELISQSREMSKIEEIASNVLGHDIAAGPVKNNRLTIYATSAAIATRLRYSQQKLLSALRRAGFDVAEVNFKVKPSIPDTEPPLVERYLSRESADQIHESACCIDDA